MCTAITYNTNDHYFGRNMDYEHGFGEKIIITPRNLPIVFKTKETMQVHYSIIGMGIAANHYPLYFDATNEFGLSMAGLNFPNNAYYFENKPGIAPYEVIPWLLGQCKTVEDGLELLKDQYIINIPLSKEYPLTPLHWLLADQKRSIVLEPTVEGLQIHDNPIGVLTNSPPFDYHIYNLSNYINVTAQEATNRFAPQTEITSYGRGMGGIGLPGDNSSASRFVRAAFAKLNSRSKNDEISSVIQFMHILNSVFQIDGCTQVGEDFEKTLYSSCCNMDKGIYYYTTYENAQISAVDMHNYNIDDHNLISIPLNRTLQISNSL